MKKMVLMFAVIIIIAVLFAGCTTNEEKLVGIWQTPNESSITFNSDNSFELSNGTHGTYTVQNNMITMIESDGITNECSYKISNDILTLTLDDNTLTFQKVESQLTEELNEENTESTTPNDTVTLESDNEYVQVTAIDFSNCVYEDGYFIGNVSYIVHTTDKYVAEYDEYFYRQIYFGFYNEDGDLVGDTITQANYIYSREYTAENETYVMIASTKPITEVKVIKIVCEKV